MVHLVSPREECPLVEHPSNSINIIRKLSGKKLIIFRISFPKIKREITF